VPIYRSLESASILLKTRGFVTSKRWRTWDGEVRRNCISNDVAARKVFQMQWIVVSYKSATSDQAVPWAFFRILGLQNLCRLTCCPTRIGVLLNNNVVIVNRGFRGGLAKLMA